MLREIFETISIFHACTVGFYNTTWAIHYCAGKFGKEEETDKDPGSQHISRSKDLPEF